MANAIELAKSYVPLLDEVYAREVLTSDLDGLSLIHIYPGDPGNLYHPRYP